MKNYSCTFNDENISKYTPETTNPLVLNVSKKILARQSIFRNLDFNIHHDIKRSPSFLTQQQIKTSTIYQKLFQRIQKCKKKEDEQKKQFIQNMHKMTNQIKSYKQQTQEAKLEIWQAKNQILDLQQALNQQIELYNQLYNQIEDPEGDEQQYEQQQDQLTQNQNGYPSQQQSSAADKQSQTYSKPTCSIKYFISNRSITTPNLSNKILSVGQGQRLFSQNDSNEQYTQLYLKNQNQQNGQLQSQHTQLFAQRRYQEESQIQVSKSKAQQGYENNNFNVKSFKKIENSIFLSL